MKLKGSPRYNSISEEWEKMTALIEVWKNNGRVWLSEFFRGNQANKKFSAPFFLLQHFQFYRPSIWTTTSGNRNNNSSQFFAHHGHAVPGVHGVAGVHGPHGVHHLEVAHPPVRVVRSSRSTRSAKKKSSSGGFSSRFQQPLNVHELDQGEHGLFRDPYPVGGGSAHDSLTSGLRLHEVATGSEVKKQSLSQPHHHHGQQQQHDVNKYHVVQRLLPDVGLAKQIVESDDYAFASLDECCHDLNNNPDSNVLRLTPGRKRDHLHLLRRRKSRARLLTNEELLKLQSFRKFLRRANVGHHGLIFRVLQIRKHQRENAFDENGVPAAKDVVR